MSFLPRLERRPRTGAPGLATALAVPVVTVLIVAVLVVTVLIVAVGGSPLSAQPSRAPDGPLIVQRHTDKRTLLRGDLINGRTTVLYRTPLDVVSTVRVAPEGRYTAALETRVDADYSTPPSNRLVLIDGTGQVAHRVERDVQTYVFSPDGMQLAYVVGRWYEGGVGFLPTALYLLDLTTWQERLVPEVTSPYELNWLQTTDEDILLSRTLGTTPRGRVTRYDLRRRRASVEPSGAFHISPDGRYVLKRADELIAEGRCGPSRGTCVEVKERHSGRAVALPDVEEAGQVVDWVYGRGHLLLFTRPQEERRTTTEVRGRRRLVGQRLEGVRGAENRVLDVATGRTVERPVGVPLVAFGRGDDGWIASRELLLLRDGGSMAPAEAPDTPLRQRLEVHVLERRGSTTESLVPQRLDLQQLDLQQLDPTRLRPAPPPPSRRRGGGGV